MDHSDIARYRLRLHFNEVRRDLSLRCLNAGRLDDGCIDIIKIELGLRAVGIQQFIRMRIVVMRRFTGVASGITSTTTTTTTASAATTFAAAVAFPIRVILRQCACVNRCDVRRL
jgi:hypothetical protein